MTQFEYYSHNKMSQVKKDFTPTLIKELKSFLVERMVDNMETKDLVEYVTDDLDQYFESLPDEFGGPAIPDGTKQETNTIKY